VIFPVYQSNKPTFELLPLSLDQVCNIGPKSQRFLDLFFGMIFFYTNLTSGSMCIFVYSCVFWNFYLFDWLV